MPSKAISTTCSKRTKTAWPSRWVSRARKRSVCQASSSSVSPLKVLPSIAQPSPSRAPRCRLDRYPRRRPWPHSAASTTRSSVWTGLTFSHAAAGRVGGLERLDHHALVAGGERRVERALRGLRVGRDEMRDPALGRERAEGGGALGQRRVEQVGAVEGEHVEEEHAERDLATQALEVAARAEPGAGHLEGVR